MDRTEPKYRAYYLSETFVNTTWFIYTFRAHRGAHVREPSKNAGMTGFSLYADNTIVRKLMRARFL